jgi:opacity protein-like surface antigen
MWVFVMVLGALALSRPAFADLTAFLGATTTPVSRTARGFAIGTGLVIVGFEFEYSDTVEDETQNAPGLRTGMFNGLLQTPVRVARMQFYATAGGGIYRETMGTASETNVGLNVGGGIKLSLAGPLRLRLDYRVFKLQGSPLSDTTPQRFYAGLNLSF